LLAYVLQWVARTKAVLSLAKHIILNLITERLATMTTTHGDWCNDAGKANANM
jgi:hypothetical protein